MAVDFLLKRDIIEQIIPEDARSQGGLSGVSDNWSAYFELITAANLTYDFILCGAYSCEDYPTTTAGNFLTVTTIQIATGAADSEVPIAEGHVLATVLVAGTITGLAICTGRTIFFQPTFIPKSTRIACRASSNSTFAVYTYMYLVGYRASQFGLPLKYLSDQSGYIKGLKGVTKASCVYPSPGTINVTSGSPRWTYGSPVEFIASATNPILITGAIACQNTTQNGAQLKICLGSAGNEVAHSKVGFAGISIVSGGGPYGDSYLPRPLFVKPGERVSVILASYNANTAYPIALKGFELK